MSTAYFVIGEPAPENAALTRVLASEAIANRPRPRWVPPASAPHPYEWIYALWALSVRRLRRLSAIRRSLGGRFLLLVLDGPCQEQILVLRLQEAVREFGPDNTLLLMLDGPGHPESWYHRPAELAGNHGCRATLVTGSRRDQAATRDLDRA